MNIRSPHTKPFRLTRSIRLIAGLTCAGAILQSPVRAAEAAPAARVQTGTIEGRVLNGTNGLYVNNARVRVDGTSIEAFTDDTGTYRLRNVQLGTVKLKVSFTGQLDLVEAVSVGAGAMTTHNFTFNPAQASNGVKGTESVQLDAFVVESQRYRNAQEIATNEERVSTNIKAVVALDSLGYQTDGNIGDFVRFLPGVDVANGSVSGNANNPDDAMTVGVRGFGSESTAILIDGMPVASGSGESLTRSVQLDALSINNASRLEVIKVATPDMSQDSPGGAINLITRGAFELSKTSYDLSIAFNGNSNNLNVFKKLPGPYEPSYKTLPSVRFSASMPLTKKLGVTFSVASDNKYSLTRNSNMRDWFQTARTATVNGVTVPVANAKGGIGIANPVIDRLELVDNQWLENRYSGSFRVDYRPFDALEIRASGQFSTMKNTGVFRRTQWRYSNGLGILDWGDGFVTGRQRTSTFNPGYSVGMTNDARDAEGFTTSGYLTVKYRKGPWTIDGKASASESFHNLPDRKNGHFSTVDASISPGRMDLVGISKGVVDDIRLFDINGNPLDYGSLSAWAPVLNSSFQARSSQVLSRDLLKQYNLDATREIDFLPFPVTLKVGGQQKEKSTHKWGAGTGYKMNYVGPTTGIPTNAELQSDFATEAKYGYSSPQYWADPSKIYQFFQKHPDYFSDTLVTAVGNVNMPANNYQSRITNTKGLTITDTDWYGMMTAKFFRNRLTVLAGARQSLKQNQGYNVFTDPKFNFVKMADGTLYRDSVYTNGVRFDGAANFGGKPRDAVITDLALRARMQTAGVPFLPNQLELAPDGIANGTATNNLNLGMLNRYTRQIDTSLKQPYTPQVQLAYEITNSLRMQIAWSRETRLPDLEAANGILVSGSSFTIIENDLHTDAPGGDGTITIANVQGRPEVNDSYNAKLSYYPKKFGGRYSISYYYKTVQKSWQTVTSFNSDADYDSLLESMGLDPNEYVNYAISTTTPSGIQQTRKGYEIEAVQNMGFLSSWTKGVDVFLTYTRRPVTASTGGESRLGWIPQVPVRAKWTGGISYSARRFSLQAKWTYLESGITYSGSGTSVTMPDGTTKVVQFYSPNINPAEVNLQGNYVISKRYSLVASANRVLSAKTYGRVADSQTGLQPDYASYRTLQDRGVSLALGVKAHF